MFSIDNNLKIIQFILFVLVFAWFSNVCSYKGRPSLLERCITCRDEEIRCWSGEFYTRLIGTMYEYYRSSGTIRYWDVDCIQRWATGILRWLFQSIQWISAAYFGRQTSSNHFGWKFIRRISKCYRWCYTENNIQMRATKVLSTTLTNLHIHSYIHTVLYCIRVWNYVLALKKLNHLFFFVFPLFRYMFYHLLFKFSPIIVRDWLVEKFVNMPKYRNWINA